MAKSFAQRLQDAQIMGTALEANLTILKKRGMTQEFIDKLINTQNSLITKNSEQEKLKASLITLTAAMNKLDKELKLQMQEAVKVVKLEAPVEQWKEYGIQAKR